jgi:hypothetical protein
MEGTNLVNASIVTYISFTFLFFVLKFRFFPNTGYFWILGFLVGSCLLQLGQNIHLTSLPEFCGATDIKLAIISTVIPWIVIFTVFTLFLMFAPGWLRVFSNTFGVAAAKAYGLKETLNEIFIKPLQSETDPKMAQLIDNIYTDQMALVIELDIENVTYDASNNILFPAMEKLAQMRVIDGAVLKNHEGLKKVHQALLLKETVGFFFWFLLIGIFCILVSTLSLVSSSCTPKVGSAYDAIFSS